MPEQTHTHDPKAKSKTLPVDGNGDVKHDKHDEHDEHDEPVEIEAKVIDNAYIELTIDSQTFTLYPDEAHRLRKVMDRAAIELPR
jgi:hypothetical protein